MNNSLICMKKLLQGDTKVENTMLPPEDQKLLEDVRTLKNVLADESGSSTDEEHVEEQQFYQVESKIVPVARYTVCVFRAKNTYYT